MEDDFPWTERSGEGGAGFEHITFIVQFIPIMISASQPVHSEGDQPWDFFGGNDAKAETPVLWPPHAKS